MSDLQSQPAQMTATVEIKRAATGKVETYTLTFHPLNDPRAEDMRPIPEQQKEEPTCR